MVKKNTKENIIKREPEPKDWDMVRTLYLRNYELDYIVKQFPDVKFTTLSILNKMRKDGVDKQKKEINERFNAHITDEVVAERRRNSEGCVKAYKKGLDIINKLLTDYRNEQEESGGIPKRCTAYNMDLLMSGLNKIQKGFDVAFGEDKNGKLYEKEPDVVVIEGIDEKKL